ncbi:MAG: hypothetical protein NC102_08625 [Clostridium sp.]|nr:hypothetical protein [Clostridium sp.]
MKKTLLSLAFAIAAIVAIAQSGCDIALSVYFAGSSSEMTDQNRTYLRNVIQNALGRSSGMASLEDSQFGVVVDADIVDEHIISGAPAKTVLNLSMNLSLADVKDGKRFSSVTIDLNGVGNSKGKAYGNAIRKLKAQSQSLESFVKKAKDEIVGYYNSNYKAIIKKAENEAAMRNYEEALYRLMCIPECCNGYDEAMAKARAVYKKFIDQQCHENLAQAQAAWMSGFTRENAAVASIFLSEIYPDAACYGEAKELVAEIKRHMGEEWKFEMKQWSDLVSVEKQQLKFAQEIATAYAQNQPQQVIHL